METSHTPRSKLLRDCLSLSSLDRCRLLCRYLIFAPFVATVALGRDDKDSWASHMLMIAFLRYVQNYLWIFVSRSDHSILPPL